MYESHFGFTSRPFTATPNADLFFPTTSTRRAFDSITSCVERASGAALVVGASGIGKSVLLQALGKHFQQDYSVAILESASVTSRKELLQNILFELGLPFHGMEEGELRLTLMDYLKPSERCPNGLLLCVDEAHMLPTALLEELRMITNLVREGQPRARLVIAGNHSIEERLADPKLESLNQRISTRAYLENMNSTECRQYVQDHLTAVGKSISDVFDEDAIDAIHVATNGIPRLINQVCDHAFVLAIADGKTRICQSMINEAWSDIQRLPVEWHVLGAQTETSNEHVIEFGELGSDDPVEFADAIDGHDAMHDGEDLATTNSTETESQNGTSGDTTNDDHTIDNEGQNEEEPKGFVLDGPANPFEEKFDQEELVVDKFSQIIGHTPQQPHFPNQPASEPVTVDMNLDEEKKELDKIRHRVTEELANQSSNSVDSDTSECETTECEANQGDSIVGNETSKAMSESEWQAGMSDATESMNKEEEPANSALETPSRNANNLSTPDPETISPSTTDPQVIEPEGDKESSALDQYLANSADAITFGVGQGIYADHFTPIGKTIEPTDASTSGKADDGNDSTQMEANESPAEFHKQPLEEEISQTVEEIKNFVNDQKSERDDSEKSDDRDMIIVEEEKKDQESPGQSDTVSMQDSPSKESTPQVKREDYQQLFDRLRNG